eukprot:10814478-Lingulodinium_polyedra.AAC.1
MACDRSPLGKINAQLVSGEIADRPDDKQQRRFSIRHARVDMQCAGSLWWLRKPSLKRANLQPAPAPWL